MENIAREVESPQVTSRGAHEAQFDDHLSILELSLRELEVVSGGQGIMMLE